MPNYTQQQFDRLPKWAQQEINVLNMRLRERDHLLQQYDGQVPTRTSIDRGMDIHPLPDDSIRFRNSIELRIERF